jgi:NitT/TauT family transport system substrate-binding protein
MGFPVEAGTAGNRHGRRRRFAAWAVLCVGLALLLGYAFDQLRTAQPEAMVERLTIAVPSAPHAALLHLATANHYFAEEGLEVTVVPTSYGKVALDMLAQGKVNLAAGAELPFVIKVMNGRDFAVVATISSATSEMAVIARRDRNIRQADDLTGKKIGVTLGTSAEYFLAAFLTRHRMAPDSVTMVDSPPDGLVQGLAAGNTDAIVAWQPVRSRALQALGPDGTALIEPNVYTATYIVAGQSNYVQQHPQIIEKLLRALLKSEQFLRNDPQQALQLVAQQTHVDASFLKPGWDDQIFRVDLLQSQLVTMEDQARWAASRSYAPEARMPDFLQRMQLDALVAVRPERVTVVH